MAIFGLKPWPVDAVMVTCPTVREANLSAMVSPRAGSCRCCGAAVLCCSRTYRQAERIAAGRVGVLYFCPPCTLGHDLSGVKATNRPDLIEKGIATQLAERN